jgi:hypothetical protein
MDWSYTHVPTPYKGNFMRSSSIQRLCYSLFILLSTAANANDVELASPIKYLTQNQTSPKASIKEISWIAGNWYGEIWGGQFEEIWSKPSAGSMMASFKFIENEQVKFYELMTISEHQDSLVLRLKHFGPQLKGWEEQDRSVDFHLVKLTDNAVYFDGYTYKRISPNELHVYVMLDSKENKQATQFVFKRRAQ